ncbi:MAG: adenosine deaminase [Candidatus Eremiobacteraeota bacterium]|nr:adenosine deaminase [Candidatus Eremiobacteraeota bacterium]
MMDRESLRALPKVQLHCHLEGTLRAATFIELAERHGVETVYRPASLDGGFAHRQNPVASLEAKAGNSDDVYRFADFGEFLLTFAAVSRSLKEPEDYARLAAEYAEDAIAQSVMYAELFISPSVWRFFHPELDPREAIVAMRRAFEKKKLDVKLICDLTRNFGIESAMQTAKLACELTDLGVIGIGLGGDEARFPAELFEEPFALARENGLHAVAHAGEAAGAQSVRNAIEVLKVERIGHGVRALEDPRVVEMLAERRIPVEICPTSNFLTGAASRNEPHPLLALDAAGVIVTIDADDPALFRSSLVDEYEYVQLIAGESALLRFAGNAIDASFADADAKNNMHSCLLTAKGRSFAVGEPGT